MSAIAHALKTGTELYICPECAKAAGGTWPPDHVATFSASKCDECGEEASTCALSDWSWPGRDGEAMRQRREM